MKRKSMFVIVLAICIILTGCENYDIIGVQPVELDYLITKIEARYFPTKTEAQEYYEAKKASGYLLFINNDLDVKEFFKSLPGEMTEDGGKIVSFMADEKQNAIDNQYEFLNDNLTLIHKEYNGEPEIEEDATAQNETTSNSETENQAADKVDLEEQALGLVGNILMQKYDEFGLMSYGIEEKNGEEYFVIEAYEESEIKITTLGWYYVSIETNEVYEEDIVTEELIKLD